MKKLIFTLAVAGCVIPGASFAQKHKENKEKEQHQKRRVGKEVTTASGLKYVITHEGEGKQAKPGDVVKVHYTGRLTNDTVFDSSVKRGQPFEFELGAGRVIKGWDEGIALLRVGDKATFTIPPELGYGAKEVGTLPANSTLIFDVELLDLKEPLKVWEAGEDTMVTKSGLKYIYVEKNKKGRQIKAGDKVEVHYSGYFTDGRKFDSSHDRNQTFSVPVGQSKVIKGWDEGLQLLKKGEKAQLIIPYQLAYGERGRQPLIPPKSTLIFDIEIIDVQDGPEPPKPFNVTGKDTVTFPSGLKMIRLNDTKGAKPTNGQAVSVHYTGYLPDGKIFDSSVERGEPISFPLGQGRVIKGWDEAISYMHVGEKARLVIPPSLGYGDRAMGPIPANSTLIFDVELVGVN